jgi:hypothetical protein
MAICICKKTLWSNISESQWNTVLIKQHNGPVQSIPITNKIVSLDPAHVKLLLAAGQWFSPVSATNKTLP